MELSITLSCITLYVCINLMFNWKEQVTMDRVELSADFERIFNYVRLRLM